MARAVANATFKEKVFFASGFGRGTLALIWLSVGCPVKLRDLAMNQNRPTSIYAIVFRSQAGKMFTGQQAKNFERSQYSGDRSRGDFGEEIDASMREFYAPQARSVLPALGLEFNRRKRKQQL